MDKILVAKLGSSSVTRDRGPDPIILANALDNALRARELGWGVVLVSSGAVSSGNALMVRQGEEGTHRLAAAVGQPLLMDFYGSVASVSGSLTCQLLIGDADLRSATQMHSIAQVIREALAHGIVPIVNGNDPANADRADNDSVAAGLAMMVGADRLLLLTDVDGVSVHDGAPPAPLIEAGRLHEIRIHSGGSGRGGMRSKLRAAELAALNGIGTRIASAQRTDAILADIRGESGGTEVRAASRRPTSGRRWISGGAISQGRLTINIAAEESIARGSGLFASGIKRVRGDFVPGDVVELVGPSDRLLGRGVIKVSSVLLGLVRALKVTEIAYVLVSILRSGDAPPAGDGQEERVRAALAAFARLSADARRSLVVEILSLFPSETASALFDGAGGFDDLVERYVGLLESTNMIHRSYLVVFDSRAGA
ncbi:MAG: glutamate 5-kinase [Microbacteriaceae bacterium]|nr:glutamate 5-kinase [Microbacteriaceae bacterium]